MIDKCESHKEIELGSFSPQLWVGRPGWVWDKIPVLLETGTLGPSLLRTQMLTAEKMHLPTVLHRWSKLPVQTELLRKRGGTHWQAPWKIKFLYKLCVCACVLSCVAIPWTMVLQVPLSIGFPRQEYWSGLSFPFPGSLPDPGIEPVSPAWQADSLPVGYLENPCICLELIKTASSF